MQRMGEQFSSPAWTVIAAKNDPLTADRTDKEWASGFIARVSALVRAGGPFLVLPRASLRRIVRGAVYTHSEIRCTMPLG
jgi:hypothetical protein